MSTVTVTELPMTFERKDVPFQIRCSRSWLDRLEQAADKLGLSAASYIRMTMTRQMALDGFPPDDTLPPKKPPRSK